MSLMEKQIISILAVGELINPFASDWEISVHPKPSFQGDNRATQLPTPEQNNKARED